MFAHLNPHSSDFGDIYALYSPFLDQLTVQSSLFEPRALRPVQATVGVGTVLIWDFCVAYTRGRGGTAAGGGYRWGGGLCRPGTIAVPHHRIQHSSRRHSYELQLIYTEIQYTLRKCVSGAPTWMAGRHRAKKMIPPPPCTLAHFPDFPATGTTCGTIVASDCSDP